MPDKSSATDSEEEGMSTAKKVATGAAVGVATAAAVGAAKKLLGSDGDSDGGTASRARSGSGRSRPTASRSRATTSKARTGTAKKSGSSGSSATKKTKEQLYAQAKRLKVEGRSSMTKAQLERAVQRARA